MKSYKESINILAVHYAECVKFWHSQGERNPKVKALTDLRNVQHNPFSPKPEWIDPKAKMDVIEIITSEIL